MFATYGTARCARAASLRSSSRWATAWHAAGDRKRTMATMAAALTLPRPATAACGEPRRESLWP
eukprot:scaffold457428_cov34-Prasinocladus_malaysianus.AAC.1